MSRQLAKPHRRREYRSLTIAPEYDSEPGARWGIAYTEGEHTDSRVFNTYNEALMCAIERLEDWHRRITKP